MNDAYTAGTEDLEAIARRGARIEATPIERIDDHAGVVPQEGRAISVNGLFTKPRKLIVSSAAEQ